jgi:hypothetical protein
MILDSRIVSQLLPEKVKNATGVEVFCGVCVCVCVFVVCCGGVGWGGVVVRLGSKNSTAYQKALSCSTRLDGDKQYLSVIEETFRNELQKITSSKVRSGWAV